LTLVYVCCCCCPPQDQDCPGGCFSPANAFDGDIAVLRIWDRVLSGDEVRRNMMRDRPDTENGLVGLYIFDREGVKTAQNGEPVAMDRAGKEQEPVLYITVGVDGQLFDMIPVDGHVHCFVACLLPQVCSTKDLRAVLEPSCVCGVRALMLLC
jgi:hypothetical protein